MCIIVAKIKGSDFPSEQIIRNCMDNNPHGFSMAWNGPDKLVHNFKTMNSDEALAKYRELSASLDPEKTGFIFHARIATHGSHKVENCHCWVEPVSTEKGDFQIAFAHNGVLRNVPNRDDMTDSETFFQDYFLPVLRTLGWDTAKKVAKAIIGFGNRFAFLCNSGNIELMGDEFIKHQEPGKKGKCYYSNSSFMRSAELFPSSYGTSGSRSGKGSDQSPYSRFGIGNTVLYNRGDGRGLQSVRMSDIDSKATRR